MTAIATTAVRSTVQFDPDPVPLQYEGLFALVAASANCRQGGIAVLSGGYYQPGTTALGLRPMGVFQKNFNNTGGAAGAANADAAGTGAEEVPGYPGARVRSGVFPMLSGTGVDAITQTSVGSLAYIIDDQTVGLTDGGGTRSPAGPILAFDTVLTLPFIGIGPQFSLGVVTPKIQVVTGVVLTAGTKLVTGLGGAAGTAFSLTASSQIIPLVTTGATAIGAQYITSSPTTGIAGAAQFTVTSTTITNTTASTDVSTLAFIIVG